MSDFLSQVSIARAIATIAHRGQTDKAGLPYIEHPTAVAQTFVGEVDGAPLQVISYLHDVLEDTDVTAEDLAAAGIDLELIGEVKLLTKEPGVDLDDYYERIANSTRARKVKIADVRHNSDPRRLALIGDDETVLRLVRKYARALDALGVDK